MARFFLGCHVTIIASLGIVKLAAYIEDVFKSRGAASYTLKPKAHDTLFASTHGTNSGYHARTDTNVR